MDEAASHQWGPNSCNKLSDVKEACKKGMPKSPRKQLSRLITTCRHTTDKPKNRTECCYPHMLAMNSAVLDHIEVVIPDPFLLKLSESRMVILLPALINRVYHISINFPQVV